MLHHNALRAVSVSAPRAAKVVLANESQGFMKETVREFSRKKRSADAHKLSQTVKQFTSEYASNDDFEVWHCMF